MILTGLLAGALLGYVLQRSGLCFHSMFARALGGDTRLLRGWLLGVGIGSVGLSLLYLSSAYDGLNTGLAFRPVQNVVGGVVIGIGMVVALSCTSGLFYKLGAGMLGAGVGIVGWAVGELVAAQVHLGGPTLLHGGVDGTITGQLGVPRIVGSLLLLAFAVGAGLRFSFGGPRLPRVRTWGWLRTGIGLGVALTVGWVLAGEGGASYGPSTVGAVVSVRDGQPRWWLIAFLVGLVLGAHLAARTTRDWKPRGETPVRYAQLAAGGFLLGAGGWIAGGCNLGHGLSGAAQLNVSSWVVVASMAAGVALAQQVRGRTRSGVLRRT